MFATVVRQHKHAARNGDRQWIMLESGQVLRLELGYCFKMQVARTSRWVDCPHRCCTTLLPAQEIGVCLAG